MEGPPPPQPIWFFFSSFLIRLFALGPKIEFKSRLSLAVASFLKRSGGIIPHHAGPSSLFPFLLLFYGPRLFFFPPQRLLILTFLVVTEFEF